jgi:hypothetical protein
MERQRKIENKPKIIQLMVLLFGVRLFEMGIFIVLPFSSPENWEEKPICRNP